jgi:hypothetical protein
MGYATEASGSSSFAMGLDAIASGRNSVALGYKVQATAEGAFALGDRTLNPLTNSTEDSFKARFTAGYTLYTNFAMDIGVQLAASGNSWSSVSDSTKKENFKPVDGEVFLEKISNFNLTSWNYKGQDKTKFRHYGPMAQDFYAAFGNDGVGTVGCDTLLSTADFMGVNFIAIQALEKRTRELNETQAKLEAKLNEIEQLKKAQAALQAKLNDMDALKADVERLMQLLNVSAKKE